MTDEFELEVLNNLKKDLNKQRIKVEKEIKKIETLQIEKIKGVSELSLKSILIEMGDVKRFKNNKQIIAFSGLDPLVKESGTSIRGRSKISKGGSKTLRGVLFKTAWGLMMHNKEYQKYYQKKKDEGKHYYTCLQQWLENFYVRFIIK